MNDIQKKTGYVNNEKAQIYYEQSGKGYPLFMIHVYGLELESGIMGHTFFRIT